MSTNSQNPGYAQQTPPQQESTHHDDGYAPSAYYQTFNSERAHTHPRVDSAGNLVALDVETGPERVSQITRTPQQSKPSRSEVLIDPAGDTTIHQGPVPGTNLVGKTITQPLFQARGDDFDGFVQTDYFKSSRPGRTSFDRDSLNASNSLSDLQGASRE